MLVDSEKQIMVCRLDFSLKVANLIPVWHGLDSLSEMPDCDAILGVVRHSLQLYLFHLVCEGAASKDHTKLLDCLSKCLRDFKV